MDVDGSEASSATHTKMALGSGDVNQAHKALYFSTRNKYFRFVLHSFTERKRDCWKNGNFFQTEPIVCHQILRKFDFWRNKNQKRNPNGSSRVQLDDFEWLRTAIDAFRCETRRIMRGRMRDKVSRASPPKQLTRLTEMPRPRPHSRRRPTAGKCRQRHLADENGNRLIIDLDSASGTIYLMLMRFYCQV